MKKISVLVTDLDNTLFDWVDIWYRSFSAMIDRIILDSGLDRERFLDEIKLVHQRHGTSEYSFLIEELPSLKELHPDENLKEIYDGAIHDFSRARKSALQLYPEVKETLSKLKESGVLIIAYTESMAFYTNYRVRNLELDGLLDYIYSPPDHDLPDNTSPQKIRKYPASHYELEKTEHRHTPQGELKPNPKLLVDIIQSVGAKLEQCVFVGDSKMKDVSMAQQAGVLDVFAEYGVAQERPEYELLRRVTHWTNEDVERERAISSGPDVEPTIILDKNFGQLLSVLDFTEFEAQ